MRFVGCCVLGALGIHSSFLVCRQILLENLIAELLLYSGISALTQNLSLSSLPSIIN